MHEWRRLEPYKIYATTRWYEEIPICFTHDLKFNATLDRTSYTHPGAIKDRQLQITCLFTLFDQYTPKNSLHIYKSRIHPQNHPDIVSCLKIKNRTSFLKPTLSKAFIIIWISTLSEPTLHKHNPSTSFHTSKLSLITITPKRIRVQRCF